jgi:glycosyltransferase involved in cell wall biosynthesis
MADDHTGSVAVVNAFKAHTGSSSVARSYYAALRKQERPVTWYQCVSSKDGGSYDQLGVAIDGYKIFRDEVNLVVNSLFVFPRKVGRLKESLTILTDPVLLRAASRLTDSVVIVHDLRELVDYRRSAAAGAYFKWLFRGLNDVQHIICDSDATRTELLRFYQPAAPVDVVHPCSGLVGNPGEHLELSLGRMSRERTVNLLCIAADRPYKNIALFYRLAKALEAPRDGWTFRFRLISRLEPDSASEIARLGAPNLEVMPAVPDVSSAYEWADVLIHPSLVEGFGLPPVEAMQFGIPILASDVPCLREVIDSGGVLVDPADLDRWKTVVTGMTDAAAYRDLANSSANRGKQFTPEAFEVRLRSWMLARQS